MNFKKLFYFAKPVIPRNTQITIRRLWTQRQRSRFASVWPVHPGSAQEPQQWSGWPEGKRFAFVLTHDVETAKGQALCPALMAMEQARGFVSSFNFVPERYADKPEIREKLIRSGCEVGVHGLNHDGMLYKSREEFSRRAVRINHYLKSWNAVGFRSPAMHHKLDWIRDLDIEYDASTFDTDPFEPQPDGVCTLFPFTVGPRDGRNGYVELPYTLAQDFTLFVLMQESNIRIWKRKVDWVVEHGGMVLVNVHPDYMCFGPEAPEIDEYPAGLYAELLDYISTRYAGEYWHALPRDVARFWKERPQRQDLVSVSSDDDGHTAG